MQTPKVLTGRKKKALVLTLLAGFMWGTSFPAIKIGLEYMDAYTFVFLRFLVALITMVFVSLLKGTMKIEVGKKRLILFLGITNGVAYLMQYLGMIFTTASKSSLLVNLSAVWVTLLSLIVLKEHLNIKRVTGVVVSLLGVVLVTTNLDFSSFSQGQILGDLFVVCAGLLWAFFIVYHKPLIDSGKNTVSSMTWLLVFTLLSLLPISFFSPINLIGLPIEAWITVVYTAICCWVIPYYLWSSGLRHTSAVVSSVVLLIEIVVAVVISTLVLGETFTAISGFGAFFIIIAILIVS